MAERFNPQHEQPEGNSPDSLQLRGRLQISTARDALVKTGINPDTAQLLTTTLDMHERLSSGKDQNDLVIFVHGGTTNGVKTAIIESLEKVAHYATTSEDQRVAFRTLHEILIEES